MKQLLISVIFFLCFLGLQAQETIVDTLESQVANEGVIEIESDPAITALLGKPGNKAKTVSENQDRVKIPGFRIQIFMGNNRSRSRTDASNKQDQIKSIFPDVETYITYESPNWRLLAGDFITREEALLFKETLQREFPQLGKEMYIVTDQINVPVEKSN
jgi:hypothetical protein